MSWTNKPRIYIAGPITKGNQFVNVYEAMQTWETLRNAGFFPFCPHLSALFELAGVASLSHEEWLEYDFEWLGVCDGLFRMPGESVGADMEVEFAKEHGIPVFHNIHEAVEYANIVSARIID